MLQEIITYMIIGSAATIAILQLTKRFREKKPKKVDFLNKNMKMGHNCTECAAECMLRDMPKRMVEKSSDFCNKEEN
jgi:hypothetical protein